MAKVTAQQVADIFWATYEKEGHDYHEAAKAAAKAMQHGDFTFGQVKHAILSIGGGEQEEMPFPSADWLSWALAHYIVLQG